MKTTNRSGADWRFALSGILLIVLMMTIVGVAPWWADTPYAERGSRSDASNPGTSENSSPRTTASGLIPSPILAVKWICHTGLAVESSPALADINGDGHLEVLVNSNDGNLYCLSSRGEPIWTYPIYGGGTTSPAIADIDRDGKLEILMEKGLGAGWIYCLSSTGTLKWDFTPSYGTSSSPAVADIDGDGRLEVVVKTYVPFGLPALVQIDCLNSTGGPKWTHTHDTFAEESSPSSSPTVGDIDGDGQAEVFVGTRAGWAYCLNGTGMIEWGHMGTPTTASPSIVDIDGDGHLEVVTGDYCLDGSGGVKWTSGVGGSSPAVANIDGDGKLEILLGSGTNLYCLNRTGGVMWKFDTGYGIESSPAIADINGDGQVDVLVGSSDGKFHCVSNTGKLEWSLTTGSGIVSSPTIADIDGDGRLEVVFGSGDGNVYCINVPSAPIISNSYPWPSIGYRGDIRHSGCYVYSDGDWLTDNYEKTAGTNPLVTDTDGDTATDSTEFTESSNPLTDTVSPAEITSLTTSKPTNDSVTLTWTAPGDNGTTGTSTGYIVVYSIAGPVTSTEWHDANEYNQSWTPLSSGSLENHSLGGLAPDTQYWFAVEAYDGIHNCAGVSNSPTTKTIDTVPPCTITDLAVIGVIGGNVTLAWTAPGDNGGAGTTESYLVKYSKSGPINGSNWGLATTYAQSWLPRSGGSSEVYTVRGLSLNTTYWFAIKAQDEVPNVGGISNSPSGMTAAPPTTIIITIVQNNTIVMNNTIVQNRTVFVPIETGPLSLVGIGVGGTGVLVALIALGFTLKKRS